MGNGQSGESFCCFLIYIYIHILPFLSNVSAFSTHTLTSSLSHSQQDDFEGSKERTALDLPALWS